MTAPITTKLWSISPNNRLTYPGTLAGVMGWWAFTNKTRLLSASWTLVWSSNGTTGPTNSGDNTDRILSASDFGVRATVAASPQSWFLVENSDGVQLLFTFQGATDDVARVSMSPGGLYTLAGTTTHQPTATDELLTSALSSVVGTSTGEDRIAHIWTADDSSAWRCVVYGSGVLRSCLTLDETVRIAPQATFPIPYVMGKFTDLSRNLNIGSGAETPVWQAGAPVAVGTANARCFLGSVFTSGVTRVCRMYGQNFTGHNNTSNYSNTAQWTGAAITLSTYCASLGGSGALCWPIHLMGERTANLDGPWGTLVDWYQVVTSSLTFPGASDSMPGYEVGDVPGVSGGQTGIGDARTNWWMAMGAGALWPWRNVAAAMETS